MNISFIIPTRNNLSYIKLAYHSIRKYNGENHEIIILDDGSSDGTRTWLKSLDDKNLKLHFNNSTEQLGHTILYDVGVNMSTNEIFTIFHADMFAGPKYVENLTKHLFKYLDGKLIKHSAVVAATRIEPPLHPEGNEKIIENYGIWPDEFEAMENKFVEDVFHLQNYEKYKDQTLSGIFAPWAMWKEDFILIGGHDPKFAPFPYEDSDIFQRMILAGYDVKQSRDSFVYHFTCRGHRWTDGKLENNNNFEKHSRNAMEHWIKKWHYWPIRNDEFGRPVFPHVYDIGYKINSTNDVYEKYDSTFLHHLELLCDNLKFDSYSQYNFWKELNYTDNGTSGFNLIKIKKPTEELNNDIIVEFELSKLDNNRLGFLYNLPFILDENIKEEGEYEFDIFKIIVNKLNYRDREIIEVNK
jgi:glycosyltransferase involved in cell wall biosynthesis